MVDMGCDIHLCVERRIERGWVCVNIAMPIHTWVNTESAFPGFCPNVATERNYDRFARLAGVRGPGPLAKGMPPDASESVRYLIEVKWASDGHSHSWMSVREAAKIFKETEYRKLDGSNAKYPEYYYFGVESNSADDYRIVFWFDN